MWCDEKNYIHVVYMKLGDIHATFTKHKDTLKPVIYLLIFIALNVGIPELMGVFDVKTSTYINYTLFFNAMLIFYLMLPRKETQF